MNSPLFNKAKEKLDSMTAEELVSELAKHGVKLEETTNQEIFYSADGETYNHSELNDAIDEMYSNTLEGETILGDVIYYGVGIRPEPIKLCDAVDIIDTLGNRAYDWGGEYADDFPNVSKEATDELNELLKGWYNKHLTVDFWQIDSKTIKEYVITEEDIKERE